jgi:tetratricopeptide (TPR) repeat protein
MRWNFRLSVGLAGGFAVLCLHSGTASAGVTVFGNGLAQICSDAAHRAARDELTDVKAAAACDTALSDESLTLHDRAGTFVNRGVLRLARGAFAKAREDFDSALELMPDLAEAFSDRGAALVALKDYGAGIADIDRGLALNCEEPEKAHYNRALAYEALDDMKDAYRDYLQAAQLKPDWPQPRIELTRFTVARQ